MSVLKRPGTAVDETLETIRDRIISGVYPPGMRISQQELAEELEVSRTPLREALQRLANEGLVLSKTNRGMQVAPASLTDVEESYYLRLLVEPPIIAPIAPSVTEADIKVMEHALVRMENPTVSTRDFQEAHAQFHQVLLHRYPKAATDLINDLHSRIYRYQRLYFGRPVTVDDFTCLDRIFMEAITERDGDRARHILQLHLLDAAIGLVREGEPQHDFKVLKVAVQALKMEIDGLGDPSAARPYPVRWLEEPGGNLPEIRTLNLHYMPAQD